MCFIDDVPFGFCGFQWLDVNLSTYIQLLSLLLAAPNLMFWPTKGLFVKRSTQYPSLTTKYDTNDVKQSARNVIHTHTYYMYLHISSASPSIYTNRTTNGVINDFGYLSSDQKHIYLVYLVGGILAG